MRNNTPDAYFIANPNALILAFDLWENGKHNRYEKALFYSKDNITEAEFDVILAKAIAYTFEPEVIQVLGALRDADGRTMRYNESFLNKLQRIDLQSFKYSTQEKSLHEKPLFSMKGSLLSITVMKQILKTWFHDISVIFE